MPIFSNARLSTFDPILLDDFIGTTDKTKKAAVKRIPKVVKK
jgi:hypothetical protein